MVRSVCAVHIQFDSKKGCIFSKYRAKKETQGYKNENIGFDWLNLANFCNPIGSNLIGSQYRHLPPDFSGTRVPKKIRAFEKSAEVSSGGRIGDPFLIRCLKRFCTWTLNLIIFCHRIIIMIIRSVPQRFFGRLFEKSFA